jgi:hypothetical protein
VHLVHDDIPEPRQRPGAGVDHVAQHLGRHHHDVCLAVDAVVAGEQTDPGGAVPGRQLGELLVAQRLDRRGVEALGALLQRQPDRELPHDRLARPGGSSNQHRPARLQCLACGDLVVVEEEVVLRAELVQLRLRGGSAAPGGGEALSGRWILRSHAFDVTSPWR